MYLVPSGIAVVFNQNKKYNNFRPQVPLSELRESPESGQKCRLCHQPGDAMDFEVFTEIGWRLRGNRDPNQPFSRLVLPLNCTNWSHDQVRTLGGLGEIHAAFSVLHSGFKGAAGKSTQILCHIGYSAGQNWYHPHYHIVQPYVDDSNQVANTQRWLLRSDYQGRPRLEFSRWDIVLGGLLSGTFWLHPKQAVKFSECYEWLAADINTLVQMTCARCRNHKNEAPDYHFMVQIGPHGELEFVYFRVILNQIGANDGAGLNMGTQCTAYFPNIEIAEILFR